MHDEDDVVTTTAAAYIFSAESRILKISFSPNGTVVTGLSNWPQICDSVAKRASRRFPMPFFPSFGSACVRQKVTESLSRKFPVSQFSALWVRDGSQLGAPMKI